MNEMNVEVKLDMNKVVFDENGTVNMMASLTAPDVSEDFKRNPLCICAVIDRSGSMYGDKMTYVRHSMWKMIDNMTENDSLSIVFFDNVCDVIPFRKMTSSNKEVMKQEFAKILPRGSTDIGSAICAANQLFDNYEGETNSIERIMVLTDGEANCGAMHMNEFKPIISSTRKGVTLSTFGYGDGFNESLLTDIAKQGRGNSYFIENPDNVSKVFAVELGGLLTCFAQDITLSIKTHKGASVTNVLNDMDVSTRQDSDGDLVTEVKVSDIYAGECRNILVRMEFEKRPQALPRPITLADITVSYRDMKSAQQKEKHAKVKIEIVKTKSAATQHPDKEVAEQVAILEAANVMVQAKKMADNGSWQEAKSFIGSASQVLREMGSETAIQFANGMDSFASDISSSYVSGGVTSKSMSSYACATTSGRGINTVGNIAFGRSKPVDMNCVMSSLVADFNLENEVNPDIAPNKEDITIGFSKHSSIKNT